MSVLVTGASGVLGRQVVERLLALDTQGVIATTRNPAGLDDLAARGVEVRHADFDDPDSLVAAFAGAQRALIISTDVLDGTDRRVRQHTAAIEAAAAAGVEHLLYTSIVNPHEGNPVVVADDHRRTEAALAASGVRWTALRHSIYSEIALLSLPAAVASGTLYAAAADGAVGFVTRADCAAAAAAALVDPDLAEGPIDVTGPEALTRHDLAAITSEVAGRAVTYVPIDVDSAVAGMVDAGMPAPVAQAMVTFDTAAAAGELDVVSSSVADLTGREPTSFASFLRAHKDQLDVA